jgi:hypothetical protein
MRVLPKVFLCFFSRCEILLQTYSEEKSSKALRVDTNDMLADPDFAVKSTQFRIVLCNTIDPSVQVVRI